MGERRPLDDVILDVEIAAIHVHPCVALPHEEARRIAAMTQDEPPVENEIEAVGGRLDLHGTTLNSGSGRHRR